MNAALSPKRVGLILPSAQVVTEPLFNRLRSGTAEFVATRVKLSGSSIADIREMERHVPRAAQLLADAGVDLIVYCCTITGAVHGSEHERETAAMLQRIAGCPATTTTLALLGNLRSLNAARLAVFTPYEAELSALEHEFFRRNGFEVEGGSDMPTSRVIDMASIPSARIAERVICQPGLQAADALVLSCMNWRAAEVAALVTRQTKKKVVTSHSATLWAIDCMLSGADLPREIDTRRSLDDATGRSPSAFYDASVGNA